MVVKPRAGFEFAVKILDSVNPVIVLLSIVGLICEYTPIKAYVIPVNQIIDLVFVLDFVVRLICFPTVRYFFRGYGWVDFLASLPGITLLLQYTPMFSVFKFVRIGRFFKIIRVLRFLRVFNFLKKMKSDSVFVQERIMKIGVSIVLVFVAGLAGADLIARGALEEERVAFYVKEHSLLGSDIEKVVQANPEVSFYAKAGILHDRTGKVLTSADMARYDEVLNSESHWFLEVPFQTEVVSVSANVRVPKEGLLVEADDLMARHDTLMLVLISTLVILLFFIIFYVGFLLAKDMKTVHLIVDSIDADDHLLLGEEARKLQSEDGSFVLEAGEDEMVSLLKMVGKLSLATNGEGSLMGSLTDSLGLGLGEHLGGKGDSAGSGEVVARLERIEALLKERLDDIVRETAVTTVKASGPAIAKYVKKLMEGK